MRANLLAIISCLVIMSCAPALADWSAELAQPEAAPQAPLELASDSAGEAPVLQMAPAPAPAPVITPGPVAPPVYTVNTPSAPAAAPAFSGSSTMMPRYMVVYKTAAPQPSLRQIMTGANAVPEPASILALVTGFGGLALKFRTRKR